MEFLKMFRIASPAVRSATGRWKRSVRSDRSDNCSYVLIRFVKSCKNAVWLYSYDFSRFRYHILTSLFCFSFLYQYVLLYPFASWQKKSIAKRRCSSRFVLLYPDLLPAAIIRLQRFCPAACNSMSLSRTRSRDDYHIFYCCRPHQRNPDTGHQPLIW